MSDEIKNPNTEEENQPDLMTLEDEDGNEITFEVIDALDYKGVHYLAAVEYAETEEEVYDLTFGSEEWQQLDAGLVSRFNGNSSMLKKAKAAGREFEVQGVLDDWLHILRPRHRMEELVRRLKSHGYCVYYLSNIPEDVLALLMERDFQGLFDGGVASCEVHVNKPDPRIYQALLDKYGLKASESVFIDDRQDNVQAAFELGFVGIRMKDSVGTLVRSLATCNVVVR